MTKGFSLAHSRVSCVQKILRWASTPQASTCWLLQPFHGTRKSCFPWAGVVAQNCLWNWFKSCITYLLARENNRTLESFLPGLRLFTLLQLRMRRRNCWTSGMFGGRPTVNSLNKRFFHFFCSFPQEKTLFLKPKESWLFCWYKKSYIII